MSPSLSFRFSDQNFVYFYHLSHACYMYRSSDPPWFDRHNNIWFNVQVTKFLIMDSSPVFRHSSPLMSKYSLHHSVFRHPQSVFLPYFESPTFRPT
jgi:hypothetical protein